MSFLAADATSEDNAPAMVAQLEPAFGGLDILLPDARGYGSPVVPDAPVSHWSRTLDLNLRAVAS